MAAPRPDRTDALLGPLRDDVRLLGELLGNVLAEAGGSDLFDDVETLRRAAIDARRGGDPDRCLELVASYPGPRAEQVARAFTVLFHLVNLAEERHRVRVLQGRDQPDSDAPADSLRAAASAIDGDALTGMLHGLRVHPVFTAHPTEARRRAVVTALRRIADLLDQYDDPEAGHSERLESRRRLLEEISTLWHTSLLRTERPDPLDEVRTLMAVFDETLFRLVPALYRSAELAIAGTDSGAAPAVVPAFLRLGSWVGGDRDGNPHVTASVTRQAADIHADHVLRALENAATRIGRTLTLAETLAPPSRALRGALTRDEDAHPQLMEQIVRASAREPHRQKVLIAAARIAATRARNADLAYSRPTELLGDLRLVQESLAAAGARRVAYGELQHLIWQVETFGFHLAELELRQHSRVHAAALADLLRSAAYDAARLDELSRTGWPHDVDPTEEATREVLSTFRAMAAVQERWGPEACPRYVVSFTRSAADLVAVTALARAAVGERPLSFDVVPLFETGEDLTAAVDTLDEWLALPGVADRLVARDRHLEVMLGYSDSAKDIGPLSATLLLADVQARLAGWAADKHIRLTLFHGRGGSLGRGGGPVNRAILAQPAGSVARRFKVTEQGEVIFARYGNSRIAMRHLEQVTSAVLFAETAEVQRRNETAARRYADLAAALSAAAARAYRELVGTEGFADFFASVSPLEELSGLVIGSRPARRSDTAERRDLSELRAIPWVFAWSQIRVNLPGWYGLGTALAAVEDLEALRAAYRDWPLFRATLDNAEMSLAKTDRGIAARFIALGDRPDLSEMVLAELDLSTRMVLAVLEQDRLLGGRAVLGAAVDLRNPYVDALSYLQLRALTDLRRAALSDDECERAKQLLLLSINGVAAGLQNTG